MLFAVQWPGCSAGCWTVPIDNHPGTARRINFSKVTYLDPSLKLTIKLGLVNTELTLTKITTVINVTIVIGVQIFSNVTLLCTVTYVTPVTNVTKKTKQKL